MVRTRANRIRRLAALATLVAALCGAADAWAAPRGRLRTIVYHGYVVSVPRSWPVYHLARAPHTCVRFNRHALYLGSPGAEQRCPARAVGRTEAILVEPAATGMRAAADGVAVQPITGPATSFVVPAAGVEVTATWLDDPQLVAAALHRRTLPRPRASAPSLRARIASGGGGAGLPGAGSVYTGPGFDACDAPSPQQMSAWTSHSPYHAIGVYIGGENAACPPGPGNPNLTTTWLNNEAAAGWHYIPTYVGLQAPRNGCGCSPIKASQASAEGTADADQAVSEAQSLGLPSGTPIYDDMEYYSRTSTNTSAVLAFLSAWTTELHARGYLSGVYGNADSAIADLATQYGTSYPEPDDIWFAAWPGDGSQTTNDPNIPAGDWTNHQRLHQYSGAHNETWGGVTLNIDGDYLDGATGGSAGPPPPVSLSVTRTATGTTSLKTSWNGLGLARWRVLAGTAPGPLTSVKSAPLKGAQTRISVQSAAPYFAVQALGSSGQLLATSAVVAAPVGVVLFGHSSFVGKATQVGALPVGCYLQSSCHLTATLTYGRTAIARSPAETFRAGGSGLLYYRLTGAGRRLVNRKHGGKVAVQVAVEDASGLGATATISLVPFATGGRAPARSVSSSAVMGAAGSTDFIHGWAGGVLVRCGTASPCWISATLSVGRTTIASARPQLIGGLELGYVFFSLTRRGHQLLVAQPGNQLGASLKLRSGSSTASARLALVRF